VKIEGDRICGPGVRDCKGGVVAGFLAMDALKECGFTDRPVVMYLQSDEEGGGKYSGDRTIGRICEAAQGSAAFLNLEGYTPGEGCIRRKGIVSYEFTVEGKAEHASNCARSGANAIIDGAQRMLILDKIKDNATLDKSYIDIPYKEGDKYKYVIL
jgi:glutamate carboxypeptidase